jgi:L-fuculose-phosphate aldolase
VSVSRTIRGEVASTAQALHGRGWVANHDGNVSMRDGQNFAATPTATSKRLITERNVVAVNSQGAVIGAGKIFGEIGLHLAVYERRPDVNCVVHAHPPSATAIACSGNNLISTPFIAEAVVSLGAHIPLLPYSSPGVAARTALAPWCELVDAVILGNHGVITWGSDAEQALLRMELLEHLANIALAAVPLGGVKYLPDSSILELLASRSKAGLGRAAEQAQKTADTLLAAARTSNTKLADGAPVTACAPAPHSSTLIGSAASPASPASPQTGQSLADIIRQEIVAALT